jgi:phosphatidylglycerophosphatase A
MTAFAAKIIGSCLGIGYLPFAPGTFASVFAAACYLLVPSLSDLHILVPTILLSVFLGIWAGAVMEKEYGKDPSQVVVDELAGQWIALAALPAEYPAILLSFVFFRFFDIRKPGPVDSAQNLPGGFGIMADDVLAGLFANISVRAVLLLASLLIQPPAL